MTEKSFSEAMAFRHACKAFDKTQKISESKMRFILEAGRLSPSSFGQEGWKFLVITNEALKEKLRPVCWNQIQITSCSHLVVVLAAIETLRPQSGVPAKRFARRDLTPEKTAIYLELYSNFLSEMMRDDTKLYAWSAKQTYIAAANMMSAAATLGIDSCPIEGFEKERVEEILALDTKAFQVSLLLPFGYRINPQTPRTRLPFDEVVTFIE